MQRSVTTRVERLTAGFLTVAVAAIAAAYAWYVWRVLLGIPPALAVAPGANLFESAAPSVRPWAPWWIPVLLVSLLAMPVWRLATRRGVRYGRSVLAMLAVAGLTFPVATLCLNVGAVLQYTPQPPLWQIVALAPTMFLEGLVLIPVNVMFHGIVIVPVTVLTGILLAGFGRAIGAVPTKASLSQLPR